MRSTPKKYVLKKCKRAYSKPWRGGAAWRVIKDRIIIGFGFTARDAWADAAEFIRRYGG